VRHSRAAVEGRHSKKISLDDDELSRCRVWQPDVCALPSEFFEFSWLINSQLAYICCLWIRESVFTDPRTFRFPDSITFWINSRRKIMSYGYGVCYGSND